MTGEGPGVSPSEGLRLQLVTAQPGGGALCEQEETGPQASSCHRGERSEPIAQDRFIVSRTLGPGAPVALTLCQILEKNKMDWEAGSLGANPTLTLTWQKAREVPGPGSHQGLKAQTELGLREPSHQAPPPALSLFWGAQLVRGASGASL